MLGYSFERCTSMHVFGVHFIDTAKPVLLMVILWFITTLSSVIFFLKNTLSPLHVLTFHVQGNLQTLSQYFSKSMTSLALHYYPIKARS